MNIHTCTPESTLRQVHADKCQETPGQELIGGGQYNMKWKRFDLVRLLEKAVWWFLTKLSILLPHDPATASLRIYANELKIYVHTKPAFGYL